MFAEQHYKAIADILNNRYRINWLDGIYNDRYKEAIEDTIVELADYFAQDNEQFDHEKFMIACGLLEDTE